MIKPFEGHLLEPEAFCEGAEGFITQAASLEGVTPREFIERRLRNRRDSARNTPDRRTGEDYDR